MAHFPVFSFESQDPIIQLFLFILGHCVRPPFVQELMIM